MMLVLGINYLNGWAMATHPTHREKPEWPPHPDRVFMALAAAHFETDGDVAERQLLEWIETLSPPQVVCSPDCRDRDTVTTFVPVNDTGDPIKKNKPLMPAGSLALGRDRQPRQFPVTIPADPIVFLAWEGCSPTVAQKRALSDLAGKVTYLGHSASFVQMWVTEELPTTMEVINATPQRWQLVPTPIEPDQAQTQQRFRLRVSGPGRLAGLESRFNRAAIEAFAHLRSEIDASKGKQKKELQQRLRDQFGEVEPQSLRPSPGLWMGYAPAQLPKQLTDAPHTCFESELLVLRRVDRARTHSQRVGLESTLLLTEALRNMAMKASSIQPPPEWLSGHQATGELSQRTLGHVAFLPLPHVGRQHADGRLLGLAIAVPRDVPPSELECLNSLLFDERGWPREINLTLGRHGKFVVKLTEEADHRIALDRETWTSQRRPSKRWASVTPVALDRHARSSTPWSEIERVVADGCERIGLPRPSEVVSSPVSIFSGTPAARQMPRIARKAQGGLIRQSHAILTFPEPVVGPVLIGAGRYRGYGLFRPIHEQSEGTS